jgi:hypothetical protein
VAGPQTVDRTPFAEASIAPTPERTQPRYAPSASHAL